MDQPWGDRDPSPMLELELAPIEEVVVDLSSGEEEFTRPPPGS